jgi:hypothetical protein
MATTPTRIFQFIGGPTFEQLFANYEGNPGFHELPGTMQRSELVFFSKFQVKSRNIKRAIEDRGRRGNRETRGRKRKRGIQFLIHFVNSKLGTKVFQKALFGSQNLDCIIYPSSFPFPLSPSLSTKVERPIQHSPPPSSLQ